MEWVALKTNCVSIPHTLDTWHFSAGGLGQWSEAITQSPSEKRKYANLESTNTRKRQGSKPASKRGTGCDTPTLAAQDASSAFAFTWPQETPSGCATPIWSASGSWSGSWNGSWTWSGRRGDATRTRTSHRDDRHATRRRASASWSAILNASATATGGGCGGRGFCVANTTVCGTENMHETGHKI